MGFFKFLKKAFTAPVKAAGKVVGGALDVPLLGQAIKTAAGLVPGVGIPLAAGLGALDSVTGPDRGNPLVGAGLGALAGYGGGRIGHMLFRKALEKEAPAYGLSLGDNAPAPVGSVAGKVGGAAVNSVAPVAAGAAAASAGGGGLGSVLKSLASPAAIGALLTGAGGLYGEISSGKAREREFNVREDQRQRQNRLSTILAPYLFELLKEKPYERGVTLGGPDAPRNLTGSYDPLGPPDIRRNITGVYG